MAGVFSNLSWLSYYFVINFFIEANRPPPGLAWCISVHVATNYFTLTTYFWMLCEGAYLQLLLMDIFHDDKKRVKGMLVVGWVTPLLIVIPYYCGVYEVDQGLCWTEFEHTSLFLVIPVILIITLNIIFLFNVMRMLRSKLEADSAVQGNRRSTSHRINSATMKQAKAALFLVPILGINFILLPMRPQPQSDFVQVYDVLSALTTSFQGFFVAVLLCVSNSEVLNLLKKRWNQFFASRNLNISFSPLVPMNYNSSSRSDQATEV